MSGKASQDDSKSNCDKPTQITPANLFDKASELIAKTGGDKQCIKDFEEAAHTHAFSAALNTSVDADALIASVKAQLTASTQDSRTDQSQKSHQEGCGSLLINANNILQQASQMQCILNNYSQKSDTLTTTSSSIRIIGAPLTVAEVQARNETIAHFSALIDSTRKQQATDYAAESLTFGANASLSPDRVYALLDRLQEQQKMTLDFLQTAFSTAMTSFDRTIRLKNTVLRVSTATNMTVGIKMTSQVQNQLKVIQNSTAKDVAAQAIANKMGVGAQDPSVKSAASNAVQSSSSSSSASKTNILSQTKVEVSSNGDVTITAPASIDMTNVTIDSNVACTVMVQAMMNQAVTSGLEAAATFLSDSKKTQDLANDIKGMDDLQKELGKTNKDAIDAGNKPVDDAVKGFFSTNWGKVAIMALVVVGLAIVAFAGIKLKQYQKGKAGGITDLSGLSNIAKK